MAGIDLDDRGAGPFRHEALLGGVMVRSAVGMTAHDRMSQLDGRELVAYAGTRWP